MIYLSGINVVYLEQHKIEIEEKKDSKDTHWISIIVSAITILQVCPKQWKQTNMKYLVLDDYSYWNIRQCFHELPDQWSITALLETLGKVMMTFFKARGNTIKSDWGSLNHLKVKG